MNEHPPSPLLDEPAGLSLREIVGVLFMRRWTILAVWLGTVATVIFLVYFLLSPWYEASTTLIINTSDLIVPLVDAPPISDFEKLTSFNTQKDIITSTAITGPVVDDLQLDKTRVIGNVERLRIWAKGVRYRVGETLGIKRWQKTHDYRAAALVAIDRNLTIETKPESRALKLVYRARSAQEAADTVNAIREHHREYFYDLITERAAGLTAYLDKQLVQAEADVQGAEDALLEFRRNDRVMLGPDLYAEVKTSAKSAGRSFAGVTDSDAVQDELKLYVLNLEDQLRELSAELTPDHPKVVGLREKLDAYLSVLDTMPQRELELHRLRRNLDLKQEMFLFLSKNLAKARMVEAGKADAIHILRTLNEAEVNDQIIRPRRRVMVALSIFLGIVLGVTAAFSLHYVDHTIRSAQDVERRLGTRVLGSLAKL